MPNSLKCRLKKLEFQGLLSEKDLSRIYTDNDVVEELVKIKSEIVELEKKMGQGIFTVELASEIVNDHISELKGE